MNVRLIGKPLVDDAEYVRIQVNGIDEAVLRKAPSQIQQRRADRFESIPEVLQELSTELPLLAQVAAFSLNLSFESSNI